MGLPDHQYDISGTKSSWRHWKRRLKVWTSRKFRRQSKQVDKELPGRKTSGWVD